MSTRPKPRPRARAPPATTALNTSALASSSAVPQLPKPVPAVRSVEDEDALFMRNQTRTAQAWKQINKMTEEKTTRKRKSKTSESSDDEGQGSSPRSHNRRKKSGKNTAVLPDWTRKKANEIEISSDSDDDILLEDSSRKTTGTGRSSSQKNKRIARSRSITPPPALPQYALQRAREAVQQLVGPRPLRSQSPIELPDESMDTIVLDPELASIAMRVQSESHRGSSPAVVSGGPEVVQIKIAWKPHPNNLGGLRENWGITQKRHDPFYALFNEVAVLAGIRVDDLVICHEGKRVFSSSNPHGIGIWAEAELEACDKATYQYLQENKRMRSVSVAPLAGESSRRSPSHGRSPSIAELSGSDSGGAGSAPTGSDDAESNAFHLTVRSEKTQGKDITLLVRPTTKCGAIVRAFLKKAGLESEYPVGGVPTKGRGRAKAAAKVPALSVDGDRMGPDTEIGEADLEDGDQVEVVGL